MKRQTLIVPLALPRLTDKAAAQLIELLHHLFDTIEHQYADQVSRYNKRQIEMRLLRQAPSAEHTDTPF